MQKLVIYTAVLGFSAVGGLLAGFLMSSAKPAPEISRPVSMAEQAASAADGATAVSAAGRKRVVLTTLAGDDGSIDDWSGTPRLVNFWATWCAPCRREIPLLKSLQAEPRPDDLQIIGIAHDELPAVRDYADEMDFNYPVLVGEIEAMEAAEAYGVELIALPITLVLGADDELITAHIGELDADEAEEIIDVLDAVARGALSTDEARASFEKSAGDR